MNAFIFLAIISLSSAASLHKNGTVLKGGVSYAVFYSRNDLSGELRYYDSYVPDLRADNFDNSVCSMKITGLWIFFEHANYNTNNGGVILWAHGIQDGFKFDQKYCRMISSARFAGNHHGWNEDSFTLYYGDFFTGDELYSYDESVNINSNSVAKSLIITGNNAWTFFSEKNYRGKAWCFDLTESDSSDPNIGTILNYGVYSKINVGQPFKSALKGCYSSNVIRSSPLKAEQKTENSAWGVINIEN